MHSHSHDMTNTARPDDRPLQLGKARYGILLWLLGIPLPLILLFYLFKGCA